MQYVSSKKRELLNIKTLSSICYTMFETSHIQYTNKLNINLHSKELNSIGKTRKVEHFYYMKEECTERLD